MKAFVTGGTGFVGSHLVDYLLSRDDTTVNCLIRSEHKWLENKNVSPFYGGLHDIDALNKGMEGADVVFHIAAIVKASNKAAFMRTNVDGTENILRIAQKQGVKKVVILSSLAATGPSFSRPVSEDDPLMPVSMYGESKKAMEEMIHQTAKSDDSITILRPPAIYGEREDQIFGVFQAASKGVFPIIGDGVSTRISLVHVDDVIQGLILAEKQQSKGVNTYFISSEEFYTWKEIKNTTADVLGKKVFALKVPAGLVKKISAIIETGASVFGRYPVINREKAAELVLQWTCSVDKAKRELGYKQSVSLHDGIQKTISWYKTHNWI